MKTSSFQLTGDGKYIAHLKFAAAKSAIYGVTEPTSTLLQNQRFMMWLIRPPIGYKISDLWCDWFDLQSAAKLAIYGVTDSTSNRLQNQRFMGWLIRSPIGCKIKDLWCDWVDLHSAAQWAIYGVTEPTYGVTEPTSTPRFFAAVNIYRYIVSLKKD